MNQWRFTAVLLSALLVSIVGVAPSQAGPSANGLTIADFNADGFDDVLFRNTAEGFVGWWYLDGNQIPGAVIVNGFGVPDPGAGFELLAAGRFDDDAYSDVLWRETSTGNLIIWFMQNLGIRESRNLGNPGATYSFAGVGDIDKNGNSDILFRQGSGPSATVSAWLIENGNFLSGTAIGTIDSNWRVLAVKDVDGVFGDDILFRNVTEGFVGWWTLNAGVITSGAGVPDPGASFSIRGWANVNTESPPRADVIWRNNTTGDLIAWIMNTDLTIASAPSLGNPGSGFSLPALGDLDGNGIVDLVFRDSTSLATWLLSGTPAFLEGSSIGSISSNWVVQNPQNTSL